MLENALDIGISEFDFWNMTFAEINRLSESKKRVKLNKLKEKAVFDYNQACLIGRAMAMSFNKNASMPDLYKAYPSIFTDGTDKQDSKQDELFALRFKLFANDYNKRYKEVKQKQ